ncbi:fused MFS/spermidine synthase [Ferrigenium sp. UT5]|uniref:fused MFS/spermidine synthase n=1 Tax=Ferrigenium sp. UT5 TaxID=3242105 RepID=UPI00354F9CAF
MSFPIDISEEAGVRYLHFGSPWIQGAMRIARPWNLELDYTKEMMAPLLLRDERRFPRKVLLIGLGAASLTKFIYRNLPLAHLTIVEIEPRVVTAAKQYFKLPEDDKRIHLVIADGAQYILGSDKKFDLILVDGFNEKARPGELNTLPFYQACRARLTAQGILAVNLIGMARGVQDSFARIAAAFDDRTLMFPSCDSGNVIAFASAGDAIEIALEDLRERAAELKANSGLNLLPTITRLEQSTTCAGGLLQL